LKSVCRRKWKGCNSSLHFATS